MKAYWPGGHGIETRDDLTIEVQAGELLELTSATLVLVSGPNGAAPEITNSSVVCVQPGRYHFRAGGEDVHVLCVTSEVFDFVARQIVGHGDSQNFIPRATKVRNVIKSLSNHEPRFSGTLASLVENSIGLQSHGA